MVPILLVTGFLGSGKTTLLNCLLQMRKVTDRTDKIALIVNEFGDVGIDGDLFPGEITTQVELPGGCICCQLDEDLKKTITGLLESEQQLTQIIIETTGIAEPLPISWTLASSELSGKVRLASVVTVVDGDNYVQHQQLAPAVNAQVDYADILVVSKAEAFEEDARKRFEDLLRKRNQLAPIVWRSESEDRRLWQILTDPTLHHQHPGEEPRHEHSHGIESLALRIDSVLDFEELSDQLEGLGPNYLRIKGIAQVVDESTGSKEPLWIAFHRVGARVSAEPIAPRARMVARMIALGTNLDRGSLLTCIQESMVDL